MTSQLWQPCREPLRVTLLRTGTIALVVGAVLATRRGGLGSGGLGRLPTATLLALWPALGGHWVEVWFLNWLRPRISGAPVVQVGARIAAWFVGGAVLALGMALTVMALDGFRPAHLGAWERAWWIGGLAFVGIELVVHLVLQL